MKWLITKGTRDVGQNKRKAEVNARSAVNKRQRGREHRVMTYHGVPRRFCGNKLGLRRRLLVWAGK